MKGQVVLSKPSGVNDPVSYFIWHNSLLCHGLANHSGLTEGAQVAVHDPRGTVIGVGRLSVGVWDGHTCDFGFTIPKVPDEPFYGIDVAGTGDVQFSRADVTADRVAVQFS